MGHKCYISFKTEDMNYKRYIQDSLNIDFIDKSLNIPIDSNDEDYILSKIRKDYLSDSTVTIYLIGEYSAENLGKHEQRFIKRELQASLYNGKGNSRNGILGVVVPKMYSKIYLGTNTCSTCGADHNVVKMDDDIAVKEFTYNYYIPNERCCHREDERYCILVKWDDFVKFPEKYIDKAYAKRTEQIADKVKVYA